MSDDETYKNKADILKSREEFPGWRRQMEMLAQDRGDVEGIFSDLGQNPNVGYQAIPPASVARRKAWNELSIKLSGKVGRKIDNAALSRIWADANSTASSAPAPGQPDQRPYRFAISMQAIERECARASESGNQIARGNFTLALQSFGMHKSTSSDPENKKSGSRRTRQSSTRVLRDTSQILRRT